MDVLRPTLFCLPRRFKPLFQIFHMSAQSSRATKRRVRTLCLKGEHLPLIPSPRIVSITWLKSMTGWMNLAWLTRRELGGSVSGHPCPMVGGHVWECPCNTGYKPQQWLPWSGSRHPPALRLRVSPPSPTSTGSVVWLTPLGALVWFSVLHRCQNSKKHVPQWPKMW